MTLAKGSDGMVVAMASLSANRARRASWYREYRVGYRIGLKTQGREWPTGVEMREFEGQVSSRGFRG